MQPYTLIYQLEQLQIGTFCIDHIGDGWNKIVFVFSRIVGIFLNGVYSLTFFVQTSVPDSETAKNLIVNLNMVLNYLFKQKDTLKLLINQGKIAVLFVAQLSLHHCEIKKNAQNVLLKKQIDILLLYYSRTKQKT